MGGLFGTNGVRGVVNEGLTPDVALRLGRAIGVYYNAPVAVATDTRTTSDLIKNAIISGLLAEGCNVQDLGVIPVPALQYYVKTHDDVMGGVMITASHNPAEYNGVKCIMGNGEELAEAGNRKIEENYGSDLLCNSTRIGTVLEIKRAAEEYIEAVLDHANIPDIKRAKLRVVVDCANGAASNTTPILLQRLGVYTVTLNANTNGEFPGRPSEPTEENLTDVIALIRAAGADLGVAHDMDGDRILFITSEGRFVSGDIALAIMSRFVLGERKGKVVTPVSTSSLVEDIVKQNGGEIVYTAVGSPIVSRAMRDSGAVFGGEENGGMIFPQFQYCRDPAMALVRMLECIIANGPLQEQMDSLPVYYMEKRDIVCPEERKGDLLQHITENCSDGRYDTIDGINA